jgi:hypothetical protein
MMSPRRCGHIASQRERLIQDRARDSWLQVAGGHEVDGRPEQQLQLPLAACQAEQPDAGRDVDQQVDITTRGLLRPSDTSEDPQTGQTVAARDPADRLPLPEQATSEGTSQVKLRPAGAGYVDPELHAGGCHEPSQGG